MASPTTWIGVLGGVGILAVEYFTTGQVSPDRVAMALSMAGIGFFAADGKVFIPFISSAINFLLSKTKSAEPVPHVIPSPTKLPEEPARDVNVARKKQSDKTKLKGVGNE